MFRGFERPPRWAVIALVISAVALAVLVPLALGRGELSSAELDRISEQIEAGGAAGAAGEGAPRLAVLGDSYSTGTGADDPARGYVNLTAEQLGWPVTIHAQGSTGYISTADDPEKARYIERVPELVADNPDIVLVQGSINDRGSSREEITAAAGEVFDALRQQLPDARVVALLPLLVPGLGDAEVQKAQLGVREAAAARGIPFIDPGGWLNVGDPALWADDRHPTQAGHEAIAARLAPELERLARGAAADPATVLALLNDPARPFTVGVLGDSTGNASDEWVYLWMRRVAEQTGRPLTVHFWDADTASYGPERSEPGGANAPITVWNGSAPGEDGAYSLEHAADMLPEQPDLLIYSHGHNEQSAQRARRDAQAALDYARTWPTPPVMVAIIQNPRTDNPAPHEDALAGTRQWAEEAGVLAVDVYAAFKAAGGLPGLLQPDGVHPNPAGSQLWADTVGAALPVPA